ncbi:MAG: iron-containing alcohol dehydrogenase [Candidatus Izemoplasma sp.]
MINFEYSSPTKIIFGKDSISKLREELITFKVKKLLLVYGKKSIKDLGIYDRIKSVVKQLDIELFEEQGVRPNPEMSSVYRGVKTCKENNIDFVLAAGGGSAIDAAKTIAFGALYEKDNIWDIYLRKEDATKSLPVGVIITLAATGTETNGNSVISNDDTHEKRSVMYSFSIPQFAIIDPTYTLSVNRHFSVAGSIDIIMHVLEQYFSNTEYTETSDYMSTGVIKSVIENTNKMLNGEDNYETRANLSWASTIGLNWILGAGKVGDWATHRLSYPVTKEYNITHGFALALIFSSWMRVALKYNKKTMKRRLQFLDKEIFDSKGYQDVPEKLDKIFKTWGANTNFKDENISITEEEIQVLVDKSLALGSIGTVIEIDNDKAYEIFKLALQKN